MSGIGRRTILAGTFGLPLLAQAAMADTAPADPTETIPLWPGTAPGLPAVAPVEKWEERSTDPAFHDRAISGMARPRLLVFRPVKANGAAMMIMPGGGYARMSADREGLEIGRWLAAHGVTAFALLYRLPGEGWARASDAPLADAQRGIRLIRAGARGLGVDPARVGAMGFSAGGHLCADLATRFGRVVYAPVDAADRLSARPTLAAPIYPVVSLSAPLAHMGSRQLLIGKDADAARERAYSPDANVAADTPPLFLVHAEDDGTVPVENSLVLRAAAKAARVPVETHLFTEGGHGFGIRRAAGLPAQRWPDLFLAWAAKRGLFT